MLTTSLSVAFIFTATSADPPETVDYTKFGINENYSTSLNSVNKLYYELFQKRNYCRDLAPLNYNLKRNSRIEDRLKILLSIQAFYVIDLDAAHQILKAYVELGIEYRDVRLGWNETEYDEIDSFCVDCNSIWVPDDFALGSLSVDETYPERFRQCKVFSNGTVYYDQMLNGEFVCQINVSKYTCSLVTLVSQLAQLKASYN